MRLLLLPFPATILALCITTLFAISSAFFLLPPHSSPRHTLSSAAADRSLPQAPGWRGGRGLLSARAQAHSRPDGAHPRAASAPPGPDPSAQECVAFITKWMPQRDREVLTQGFVDDHVALALAARARTPWGADVPRDVFMNYVLPYASLIEKRESWRGMFMNALMDLAASASSSADAGALLNDRIWDMFGIKYSAGQTPQTMSVYETLAAKNASCTGLSIFLVSACRAVGVPARVVGTPEWNTPEGGNHNWVEVYDTEKDTWLFTGAAEWGGWDRGWFFPQPAKKQVPHDLKHGIYATAWSPPGPFPVNPEVYVPISWAPEDRSVRGVDVTSRYLEEPPPTPPGFGGVS